MFTDLFQYLWSDESDLKVVASKDVCILKTRGKLKLRKVPQHLRKMTLCLLLSPGFEIKSIDSL